MRLGQLARKLAVRPADIAEFLAQNNIQLAASTNVRLEKEQVALIMKRFVPGWVESPMEEVEEKTVVNEIAPESPVSEQLPVIEVTEDTELQSSPPETNEVIRAPKVELSGLKVVGKIELPEPKKKEEPLKEEDTPSENGTTERREGRRNFDTNQKRPQRPQKNPIAIQREKEAKEAQRKLQEKQALEKEKRTQKYLRNYKPTAPTKAAKLVKEELVEMTAQELGEPPKTLFGKILRWLTKAG
jgi:hypothetical protein